MVWYVGININVLEQYPESLLKWRYDTEISSFNFKHYYDAWINITKSFFPRYYVSFSNLSVTENGK